MIPHPPTDVIIAPPNACRGIPSLVRSRLRSEVSQAAVRRTKRSAPGGNRASRSFPRPSSGSEPASMAAQRLVSSRPISAADFRSASRTLTPVRSWPPSAATMKNTSTLSRSCSRPRASRIRSSGTTVSLCATARATRWVTVTCTPLLARTASRYCSSARVEFQVAVELGVHRASPSRSGQLPPAVHPP